MSEKNEKIGPDGTLKIADDVDRDDIENVSDSGANDERTYERGTGFHRYSNSLKNLIPIRRKGKETHTMGVDSTGLFSSICFTWMTKIMYKAYGEGITMEELPTLSPYDGGTYNAKRLELLWNEELAKKGPEDASLSRVAWRFCRTRIFTVWLIFIGNLISSFLSYTFLMRKLLEYVQSGNGSYVEGAKWVLLLTAAELSRTLFMAWTWAFNTRTAVRLRSACLILLYGKIIRVENLGNENIGKVINTFANDAQTIFESVRLGPLIFGAPIATVFGVFYILWLLGPMALLGMIAFLLFFPIQYIMSRITGHFLTKTVKISDLRIRLMNEILDCIKLIKMYAWEKRFNKDLLGLRKTEKRLLLQTSYCRNFSDSMAPTVPVVSAIITFLAHVSVGNNLTASQAFPYTTFLHSGLTLLLFFFQISIAYIISAGVSFERMQSLLLLEDTDRSISKPIRESQALEISHGTFAYNTSYDYNTERSQSDKKKRTSASTIAVEYSEQQKLNQPANNAKHVDVLFNVSFEAEKGKLIGICGLVGSGKTSLLLAAMGQLRVSKGQVMRDGSCAYVGQQAWITNATLRENILFGAKFDQSQYNKAIYACSLSQDIGMMPGGDQTEIGEKGVNLSGGQKQRVALARALYADRDIYFLDDPLSAVDSRVGAFIFDNLILGALRGKTVLFVTHQIQYLNRCDDIYMMHDGRIIEHGTHDELIKLGNQYASMVTAVLTNNETANEPIIDQTTESLLQSVADISTLGTSRSRAGSVSSQVIGLKSVENLDPDGAQLIVAENLQQGSIKADTYHSYIMAAGGYFSVLLVILTFIATAASIAFSSWWLAFWIKAGGGNTIIVRNNETIPSDNLNDNPNFWYYQSIYAGTIGLIVLTSAVRSLVYTKATIEASTKLHNDLFEKLITSSMRFFDTTPSGRIQHLFSRDMDEVDSRLPMVVANIIQNVITISFTMLTICLVFPWFILPMGVLAVLYYYVSKIFRVAIRDLKRMDNKSRAPIISFVTTTIQGLSTIHAFGKEKNFMTKFTKLFDANSKCMMLYVGAMRWVAVRIEGLTVAITGTTAFLVVALQGQVPPALAGLALSYSAHISDMFQHTIRILSETEVRFISVERINHFIKTLESEGSTKQPTVKPPSSWPAAAEIKFISVSMAYGDGTPLVLKNVSFTIEAGEKIGIVGRTGSGKSSLTVALFRLVELAKGNIKIDNIDISEISLDQLRTKLAIIPQDPVLFSGTIRSNLDPFKLYTDVEIWKALEKTELKGRVQSMTGQLAASVEFGGVNLSVGERQLLCLSRALLRNSKILILDEATASVDPETEIAIQKSIHREFSNCTVLTIAHRLQTVLSLDRVLLMDSGEVLEFDTPSNLLGNLSSEFSKMIAVAESAER